MSTLQEKEKKAKELFGKADEAGKSQLIELFGQELFIPTIKDRITCMNDALLESKEEQPDEIKMLLNYKGDHPDVLALAAFAKLTIGIRVLNKGKKRNYDKPEQFKYEPAFKMSSAGSGFSYHDYDYWTSGSYAGSRLAYLDKELMLYGTEIFKPEYKALYTE